MTATGDTSGLAAGLVADDLPAPTVQCHAANLMPLPGEQGERLGCVWFGGTQEGVADISIWFSHRSPGPAGGWSAPVRLSDDAERSEQNPILFNAPDGSLWLLHTAQRSGHQDTALVRWRRSTDGGATWSEPAQLFPDAGIFVRQPVIVTPSHWLVPIFHCRTTPGVRWSGDHDDSAVMVSTDQGRTWVERPVPGSLGCVHMNIVAGHPSKGQPGEFFAFYRSRWADHVYRSASTDGGLSWSAPRPTELPNNNSSIQVVRLTQGPYAGQLAMVFNAVSAAQATERRVSLYDEIEGESEDGHDAAYAAAPAGGRSAFWGTPRAPMTLALSDDDGLTWPLRVDLETGDGYCMTNNSAEQRNRELSYPSLVQSADGTLHVAYTHHRQRIRHLALSPEWLTLNLRAQRPAAA
jgi:predicted neuraminidase